jgi:Domain of unknown function (DUF4091)
MGWMCFLYRASGELYYSVTHCLNELYKDQGVWVGQFSYGGNGDGTLFYPGNPKDIGGNNWIPIESMRLKLIRDGYQDYEYLKILADRNQRDEALKIAMGLFPPAQGTDAGMMYSTNTSDDSAIPTARAKLAHLIDPTYAP